MSGQPAEHVMESRIVAWEGGCTMRKNAEVKEKLVAVPDVGLEMFIDRSVALTVEK